MSPTIWRVGDKGIAFIKGIWIDFIQANQSGFPSVK